MNLYKIEVQFASANAPDFDERIMSIIRRSVEEYNARSRLAKNPKQVVDLSKLDAKTVLLVLQSVAELPHPGKALRLLSQICLAPSTEGHLGEFVSSGKQLFKMRAEPVSGHMPARSSPEGIDSLRVQAIALALTATADQLNEAINILTNKMEVTR